MSFAERGLAMQGLAKLGRIIVESFDEQGLIFIESFTEQDHTTQGLVIRGLV